MPQQWGLQLFHGLYKGQIIQVQTTGAYAGSGYSSQANMWSQGSYTNYYANYNQDSSSAYSSTNAAATTTPNYEQHYKQWADYYNSQTEVTCAPGTENTTVTNSATMSCAIPGASSGYVTPISQTQPSYVAAWRPEPAPSAVPSVQV
uniref:Uncharacterized protein n=1 Tax=Opuntia streptacantha TaxID=393608 RepID=A0A7C9EPK0_OPUST